MVCEVIIDIKNNQVNKSFDYLVPSHLIGFLEVGHRVKVQFGKRKLVGFVVGIKDATTYSSNLKEVEEVLELSPSLLPEFIDLAFYMAKEYYSFYINCLEIMIPSALRAKYLQNLEILNDDSLSEELKTLFNGKKVIPLTNEMRKNYKYIQMGIACGSVKVVDVIKTSARKKMISMVRLLDSSIISKSKQGTSLIKYLEEINQDIPKEELINEVGYSNNIIKTLVKNKALEIYDKEIYRDIELFKDYQEKKVVLNEQQEYAFNKIKESLLSHKEFLLHGVTGSGKTEVYLNLIEECLKLNKQAIMLVPEISLTPQMVHKVKSRFLEGVAVFHSGLSGNEKYDQWRKVKRGEASIVVGARSAIFAPLNNIGIIIIDEEHESSYKQDVNPRYDTYVVAKKRTQTHNAILLLGSATPSIETYYKTKTGEIELLELPKRANNLAMPKTNIIDMRLELKKGNKSVFSRDLEKALQRTLLRNEQAILFLNRRGFSSFVMCRECGEVIKCPHCDITLTYHAVNDMLRCHYCGFKTPNVDACPSCKSSYIRFVGGGTQKIESEIIKLFPEARVLRVDTDTTNKKNMTEIMFDRFRRHEVDILIGTQIIAKGLDFPNVTLVGVLNADMGLRIPSYDAFEKTYSIIEQVSGRAGRSNKPGEIFIQTYNSDNYAIVNAATHNYHSFYEQEINIRRLSNNPPFSELVEIIISSTDINKAKKEINAINRNLMKNKDINVFGPVEHNIFKMNDLYRYVLTVKFINHSLTILEYINTLYQNKKDVYLTITRM